MKCRKCYNYIENCNCLPPKIVNPLDIKKLKEEEERGKEDKQKRSNEINRKKS